MTFFPTTCIYIQCASKLFIFTDVLQEVKWGNGNKNNCKMEVPWNVLNTSAIILLWCPLTHFYSSNSFSTRLYGTPLSCCFHVLSSSGSKPSVNYVSACSARLLCSNMLLVPKKHGTKVLCVQSFIKRTGHREPQ